MTLFTLFSKAGYPLITVLAENEAQARLQAKEQVMHWLNYNAQPGANLDV